MLQSLTKKNTAGLLKINSREKITLLLQTMFIFWLLAKKIGWKMWMKERLLPTAPVFDFLDFPSFIHSFLFAVTVLALLALLFKPRNQFLFIVLLVAEMLSCLADQNRWQPYEYQYLFVIIICLINFSQREKIIPCLAFMLFAIYLYSGFGKLNNGYLLLFWDRMFLHQYLNVNTENIQNGFIYYSGYITAVIEILAAIGLLFKGTQRMSAWVLIIMHGLILILLGPFGLRYNKIIWPWNMLMMVWLYFIFLHEGFIQINFKSLWKGWNKAVVICWGILPLFNYFGLWDNYLSLRLYSGTLTQMIFCVKDENEIKELKPYLNNGDVYNICKGNAMVNIQTWAMRETGVPPYPEMRVYKKITERWMEKHKGSKTKTFFYYAVSKKEIKLIKP